MNNAKKLTVLAVGVGTSLALSLVACGNPSTSNPSSLGANSTGTLGIDAVSADEAVPSGERIDKLPLEDNSDMVEVDGEFYFPIGSDFHTMDVTLYKTGAPAGYVPAASIEDLLMETPKITLKPFDIISTVAAEDYELPEGYIYWADVENYFDYISLGSLEYNIDAICVGTSEIWSTIELLAQDWDCTVYNYDAETGLMFPENFEAGSAMAQDLMPYCEPMVIGEEGSEDAQYLLHYNIAFHISDGSDLEIELYTDLEPGCVYTYSMRNSGWFDGRGSICFVTDSNTRFNFETFSCSDYNYGARAGEEPLDSVFHEEYTDPDLIIDPNESGNIESEN